jgi:putative sterol carrier protein
MVAMPIRSIDDYLRLMRESFLPAAAANRSMVLQYDFSGDICGVCHAVIAAGQIQTAHGPHPKPTSVVHADFNLWLHVIAHEIDPLIAYQDGLFTVEGDGLALMDSDLWFAHS